MEQLSPFPLEAMMKARRSKNAPFGHELNWGRNGADVPFILSKIVGLLLYHHKSLLRHRTLEFAMRMCRAEDVLACVACQFVLFLWP